jgi:hypothetical protein
MILYENINECSTYKVNQITVYFTFRPVYITLSVFYTLCILYLELRDNGRPRPKHVADRLNEINSVSVLTVYFVGS